MHEEVLTNYMDNFVILAKTKKELEKRTIKFLNMAEKYNLCFKQSKCDFDTKEIPILEVDKGKYKWKTKRPRQSRNGKHSPR